MLVLKEDGLQPKYGVNWELQGVRFVCVSMYHFWFASEVDVAIKSLKFVALNQRKFDRPLLAFTCSLI